MPRSPAKTKNGRHIDKKTYHTEPQPNLDASTSTSRMTLPDRKLFIQKNKLFLFVYSTRKGKAKNPFFSTLSSLTQFLTSRRLA